MNETLQEAGESYMEKLEEVQNLQNRLSNQVRACTVFKNLLYGNALVLKAFFIVDRSKKLSVYKVM